MAVVDLLVVLLRRTFDVTNVAVVHDVHTL